MSAIGLREQNKRNTFEGITSAASRLFRAGGYTRTTIEAIAREAGVSIGTVYNYFGTKNAILTAVVTKDMEVAFADAAAAIDLSADNAVASLMHVIDVYVDAMTALGPVVLRELFRTVLDPTEAYLARELISIDERAVDQIAQAFEKLQGARLVSRDVDPSEASVLIYSLIAAATIVYTSIPDSTPDDVKTTVRRQLALVMDGIGP